MGGNPDSPAATPGPVALHPNSSRVGADHPPMNTPAVGASFNNDNISRASSYNGSPRFRDFGDGAEDGCRQAAESNGFHDE